MLRSRGAVLCSIKAVRWTAGRKIENKQPLRGQDFQHSRKGASFRTYPEKVILPWAPAPPHHTPSTHQCRGTPHRLASETLANPYLSSFLSSSPCSCLPSTPLYSFFHPSCLPTQRSFFKLPSRLDQSKLIVKQSLFLILQQKEPTVNLDWCLLHSTLNSNYQNTLVTHSGLFPKRPFSRNIQSPNIN